MNGDNFSYKEMLITVMTKIDTLTIGVNKQELLLNSIHEASAGRDEKIKDLKRDVKTLQDEVVTLTLKVQSLKAFNRNIVAIWSFVVVLVSVFGREVFNFVFR
jgi:hypothetical protein